MKERLGSYSFTMTATNSSGIGWSHSYWDPCMHEPMKVLKALESSEDSLVQAYLKDFVCNFWGLVYTTQILT